MKTYLAVTVQLSLLFLAVSTRAALSQNSDAYKSAAVSPPAQQSPGAIPMDQIGAVAGKQYAGDGLTVMATSDGELLRCAFQRLDGEATRDGLWLTSAVADRASDRFRVKAVAVGNEPLSNSSIVSVEGQAVRFTRAGLVEEYSVSMDGVRQDFVVMEKPGSSGRESAPSQANSGQSEPTHVGCSRREGELRVNLAVSGARVEQTVAGAQLVLEKSGRKIAYSRLKVTDANGRELPARFEVASDSALHTPHSEFAMAVVVDDAGASYPIRIDPTFSDANWVSMGGIPGADSWISATVVDGSGNLYISGAFTKVGTTYANRIAKWNGSSWSALGSGMNNSVHALAVSGNDVYAGGYFTNAGGIAASCRVVRNWSACEWQAEVIGY